MKLILFLFSLLFFTHSFAQTELAYRIYLIGDTGDPVIEGEDPVWSHLQPRLLNENKESTILFLGDNIYHNGMPPESKGKIEREEAERKILVQLDAVDQYKGKVYFIPGNHDWNDASADGINYIQAQEEFIEMYLDRGDVMIPDHGCPGPEVKNLAKDVVLIAMDSQWWLHPHPDDDLHHSACRNKNRHEIIQELTEILDKNDDKFILLAFHHPIYSDGSHNGYFTLKDHVFPLSSLVKGLYLPLPGLGSLYPFYRSAFGARQDMAHPLYSDFKERILETLYGYSNVLVASGHEHNLQYFYENEHHFIKSGSGSKTSPLPRINDAAFSSDKKGYSVIDITQKGEVHLKYYTIEGDSEVLAFSRQIISGPLRIPQHLEPYELSEKLVRVAASDTYTTTKFHQMLFGKLHRKDWATTSDFRALNLSTEKGGLIPVKAGGGMTSNSLRLEDKNKDQFVLRSVQKSVSKVVPPGFRNTLVQKIFQDQIAASQPYAALAVPPLAQAAGVYHTNPDIVYLPKQPGLGDFGQFYGDELYLFEERPAGDRKDDDSFGNSQKIISYSKMIDQIRKTPKHHVHQDQVLRSRLFDIYLGDWDRHDDQWRWASFKEIHDHDGEDEEVTFYEPIPRDRDQVFFRYKGFIPWLSKLLSPQLRKFISFGPTIKNVKYLGFNARHFDRSFLNEMNRQDWVEMASLMQSNITDEVINESINRLPSEIVDMRGEFYSNSLISRRNDLVKYASDYYSYLAKYVDVVGTDKDEMFEVTRNSDNTVDVTVHKINKSREKEEVLFERSFKHKETKEIRLYGLDGKDHFHLDGSQNKGPLVRIIGGEGIDVLRDESDMKGLKSSVIIYDSENGNDFVLGRDAKDKRTNNFRDNLYDRREFYYNAGVGFTLLGYNPDDGLKISYNQSMNIYGYRKTPFKARHNISASYSIGSGDIGLGYELDLPRIIENTGFHLATEVSLPKNVDNFFGLTNEITFDVNDADDFNFYRYQKTDIFLHPAFSWMNEDEIHHLYFGPYYRFTNLQDNQGRFVEDLEASGLSAEEFENIHYVGLSMEYELNKVDDEILPTSGIRLSLQPSLNYNLKDADETYTRLYGSLTLYNFIWVPRPFILASKIEGGVNFGDFNFFQANYAGRNTGLRAFRQNRFGGHSSFTWSNDLKVNVLSSPNRALPFSMGLIASFDYGRAWSDEVSDSWHSGYGGGLWFNLFDVIPVSIYYMTSDEGESGVILKMGFSI